MTKHTPGPWEASYKKKYDEWYVSVPSSDSSMRVNIFPDGVPGDEPGEAEANARLIAASPELLAAVEATYDMLDGIYGAKQGESIPYFTLTPDRKKACDKALGLVHGVMHKLRKGEQV